MSGFQTAVREGLTLTVGQAARVELTLNLGGLSTEVQVVAETPLLNTESATLSQVITNEQIVDLPLNGRGFHELARLTSGVALLPPTGNTQPVRPEVVNGNVIGGVAGAQTRFLLDGVDITEEHQGGTWIQTSVDALQEFSVQQNAYSAEFHGAGATFNVTTKSGGNTFHGSIFEFMRNDAFDSKNFFAVNKEKLTRNQFGGTLGGPLMIPGLYDGRNKTFFFASYEGHRRQQGVTDVSIVPSAAQRQGDFSGLAPIFDPLTTTTVGGVATRTQFANNQIPANRISPQAQFFMKYIPLPNAPGNTYVSNPITSFNQNQMTLRLDQEINSQNRFFARYSQHVNAEDRQDRWDTLGSTRLEGPAYNLALSLTSNFGSSLVHEVRFSRMYGEYRSTAYFQGQGVDLVQNQAGVKGLAGIQDPAHCQPAGLHHQRISGIFWKRRRRPAEVAGPRRVRAHRQPHVDQRQAHPEVRRQDVSPQHPVHRRAKPQRRVHLQRCHDAAPGHVGRHGSFLCRFHSRVSVGGHAVEPGDVVGRIRARTGMASSRMTTG